MYCQLPSDIVDRATTFDIMVADVYSAWERHKANPTDTAQYQTDDLMSLLESTRR